MCYFYKWTYDYVLGLDVESYLKFYEAISVIEAQEQLRLLSSSDWPHLNKNDRKRIDKDLRRIAYPIQSSQEKRSLTTGELMAALGMNHGGR